MIKRERNRQNKTPNNQTKGTTNKKNSPERGQLLGIKQSYDYKNYE